MKSGVYNGAMIWKICSSIEQSEQRKIRKRAKITILPASSRFRGGFYSGVQEIHRALVFGNKKLKRNKTLRKI